MWSYSMPSPSSRLATIEALVAQYEKSLEQLAALQQKLRALPPTVRVAETLAQNEKAVASTRRLLDLARSRLALEKSVALIRSDLDRVSRRDA